MIDEVILCKYGEIVLKGQNRRNFESMLVKELRRRAKAIGKFTVRLAQSTVYIEPASDDPFESDMDAMFEQARKVFGFVGVTKAAVAEKNMEDILRVAREYLPPLMAGKTRFRVDAKRADKSFPLPSPTIAAEVGGALLATVPGLRVDLHNPECNIRVEIRESAAYVHADQERGAGGMPPRSGGRGLLLLSGGIDSPVAGFMMAKRGVEIEALHFESFPYTSERAREKVMTLASELCEYVGRIHVHVISLTHIQEELRAKCEEDYFTLLLRRFMMVLAERCAATYTCSALITGESLGQVASQTMAAITVTDEATSLPVLRPCIGLDKNEIVNIARDIGTYETSILPYEDCCTVFTPRHPRTRPVLEKVLAEQAKVDFDALVEEAFAGMYTVKCTVDKH
jgi:thiamine biosynthesis protein ThiI